LGRGAKDQQHIGAEDDGNHQQSRKGISAIGIGSSTATWAGYAAGCGARTAPTLTLDTTSATRRSLRI
jgi:hypothetical protein